MKKIIFALMLTLSLANISIAQNQYEVLVEGKNEKSLKGIISQEVLLNDTSFKWYADNLKGYTPNSNAIAGLKKHADSVQLVVFMGTWCEDSHNIIPKFYTLLETSGFSKEKVTVIGVDRAKKTLSHLTEALNVTNVPTIMVMKNGKEIGRVVEYGKYGLFDKELGEILKKLDN